MSPVTKYLENSDIKLATAAVVGISVIGAAIGLSKWMFAVDQTLKEIRTAMESSYTLDRAAEVALRTAVSNPGMQVPDPRDPGRIIMVKHADRELRMGQP